MRGAHHYYIHLPIMLALSFVAMYVLMYAMVDRFGNVYPNVNQIYMAGLMAAPMALIELLVMRAMYKNRRANLTIGAAAVVAMLAFFAAIRAQTAVTDAQFLKSMIPHHAGAILMCERAAITDPAIQELCRGIRKSQQDEIDGMKAMLAALEK
jgi:uncharacterized protein (DUF305 family)